MLVVAAIQNAFEAGLRDVFKALTKFGVGIGQGWGPGTISFVMTDSTDCYGLENNTVTETFTLNEVIM